MMFLLSRESTRLLNCHALLLIILCLLHIFSLPKTVTSMEKEDDLSHLLPLSSVDVEFYIGKDGKSRAKVIMVQSSEDNSNIRRRRADVQDIKIEFHLEQIIDVFGDDAKLEIVTSENRDHNTVVPLKSESMSFMMRPFENSNSKSKEWAVFTIRKDKEMNPIVHGVYTMNDGTRMIQISHIEKHKKDSNENGYRRLEEIATGKHVLEPVDMERSQQVLNSLSKKKDKKLICPVKNKKKGKKEPNPIKSVTSSDYYSFTPDCYTGDSLTRQFNIGVAVDVGFYKALGSTEAAVKQSVEDMVTSTRIVYLMQLNIIPVVQNLDITTSTTAPVPLNGDPASGTCGTSFEYGLTLFQQWNVNTNDNLVARRRGLWHFLTGCYQETSTAGYANMNVICDLSRNVGMTKYLPSSQLWQIFAHELGHGFGATHSFGIGGLMDYGNPYWNGMIQFDSGKRSEMCSEIDSVVQTCSHFVIMSNASSCGNGVIEKGEMCECLTIGSTSCGGCVDCNLARSSIQCSSQDFQMRITAADMTADYIYVKRTSLSDSQCCSTDGILSTPAVSCNSGNGVCANGVCIKLCSAYNLPACDTLNNGCIQACTYSGKCTSTLTSASGVKISWAPDGTKCGSNAVCGSGECISSTPSTPNPTNKPNTLKPTTLSPTAKPTTLKPTSLPTTVAPTLPKPTKAPTTGKPTKTPTTKKPTVIPTTKKPTITPTSKPTKSPITPKPTKAPTTKKPTALPTTKKPSLNPTVKPSKSPTYPTASPTKKPKKKKKSG